MPGPILSYCRFDKVLQRIFSYGIVIFGVKFTRRSIPATVLRFSGVLLRKERSAEDNTKPQLEEVREDGSYLHETAA